MINREPFEDKKPERVPMNDLDTVLIALAESDRQGRDGRWLHEDRQELMAQGMKPTIKPFCYRCNGTCKGFGALCTSCYKEVYPSS